jgi:hypothetical protein
MSASDILLPTKNKSFDQDPTKVAYEGVPPPFVLPLYWPAVRAVQSVDGRAYDSHNQQIVPGPVVPRPSEISVRPGRVESNTLNNLRMNVHPDGFPTSTVPIPAYVNSIIDDSRFAHINANIRDLMEDDFENKALSVVQRNNRIVGRKSFRHKPYKEVQPRVAEEEPFPEKEELPKKIAVPKKAEKVKRSSRLLDFEEIE